MKKLIGIVVLLAILVGGFMALPNEVTDRLNPLVPKEEVFVQINEPGNPKNPGGYDYTLTGFNADGEKREVTFYAGKELRKDAFLKVYVKGSYVETWEEVQPVALPVKAREKISK
ncbi:YxeA family protein [Halobacillus shinanisalinarum]|uniref:YxeA family protein n=1 Tax=Halobacillus shinanisalinarum TaxID=2932258 RepID=A0ABY4GXV8_9BACI|nr:YxeA family protein [Halobacillus shinanisalinarum]UOQ92904.1 YxeA family protein [Halobacillus shinanisalinarum]